MSAQDPDREKETPGTPPEIDLSAEDLDVEPLDRPSGPPPELAPGPEPPPGPGWGWAEPGAAGPDAPGDVLVIESHDLLDVEEPPRAGYAYPSLDQLGPTPPGYAKKGKGDLLSGGLVGSLLIQMALAGALGGLLAWMVTEPGSRATEASREFLHLSRQEELLQMAGFGGALGGFIGLALGAVEGVLLSAWRRAFTGASLGLLVGGAGGAAGGVVGQMVFSALSPEESGRGSAAVFIRVVLARAIAWALVGACVGLGPGIMMMAPRRIVNGILGGLAGGLAGGLLFDPMAMAVSALGPMHGTLSRLLGIVVVGLCAGAGVGLLEEVRKEAWLVIISGPLAGKQFILYKPTTWIGSAPGLDIPLIKDRSVAPKQCAVEQGRAGHVLRDLAGGTTYLNGQRVADRRLVDGDVIQIGQTGLSYNSRPLAAGPAGGSAAGLGGGVFPR